MYEIREMQKMVLVLYFFMFVLNAGIGLVLERGQDEIAAQVEQCLGD